MDEDCGCLIHAGMGLGGIIIIVLLFVFIPIGFRKFRNMRGKSRERREQDRLDSIQRKADEERAAVSLRGYRGIQPGDSDGQ